MKLFAKKIVHDAFLLALVFTLGGCAFTPQQLNVQPVVEIKGGAFGQGRLFRFVAIDNRDNAVLGSRGGVYQDSSVITVGNNIEAALGEAFIAAMMHYGFVLNQDVTESMALTLYLEELRYSSPDVMYSNKVNMEAILRIEVVKDGRTWTKSYTSRGDKRFVFAPRKSGAEKVVNALLASTMERIFADPVFVAFVSS